MDRPHHPLVIRPWKTRQTQQQKCGAPPFKGPKPFSTGKETRKNPKRSG